MKVIYTKHLYINVYSNLPYKEALKITAAKASKTVNKFGKLYYISLFYPVTSKARGRGKGPPKPPARPTYNYSNNPENRNNEDNDNENNKNDYDENIFGNKINYPGNYFEFDYNYFKRYNPYYRSKIPPLPPPRYSYSSNIRKPEFNE